MSSISTTFNSTRLFFRNASNIFFNSIYSRQRVKIKGRPEKVILIQIIMTTTVKIEDIRHKPFTGADGEEVDYYWTKAVRRRDGITFTFGTTVDHSQQMGQSVDLNIEKYENSQGRTGYREIV